MEEFNPMKAFIEGKVCVEVGAIKMWMTEEDAEKCKKMSINLEDIEKYLTGSVKNKNKNKNKNK